MVLEGHPLNDATTQTLNYALGNLGGRQKSWMTEPSPAVPVAPMAKRPRGRPPKPAAPLPAHPSRPQTHQSVRASTENHPEWQPTSNSTSPYLANTLARPNSASTGAGSIHATPTVTVLPSPTPSEESIANVSTMVSVSNITNVPTMANATTPTAATYQPNQTASNYDFFDLDTLDAYYPPDDPQNVATPPHQPLEPASHWYTWDDVGYRLNAFESSHRAASQHPRDSARLAVLRDAAAKQDWAYLTMHQFYCMLTSNPAAVPVGLRSLPRLPMAVKVMQDVLDSNDNLSHEVLNFFASFPYSMEELGAKWPAEFQKQGEQFLQFVNHSSNYERLKNACRARKCPPVVREIFVELRIYSPTFRRLLFTMLLRAIWRGPPQPSLQAHFESQALAVFQQNDDDFQLQAALQSDLLSSGPQQHLLETETELRTWGSQLQRLGAAFEASFSTRAPQPAFQHLTAPQPQQQPRPRPRPQSYLPVFPQPTQPTQPTQPLQPQYPLAQAYPSFGPSSAPMPRQTAPQPSYGRGRGRYRATVPQTPHALPSQSRTLQSRSSSRPLLPQKGWTQPQQRTPNPARFGLHQALLRSPVLQAQSTTSPLYQFPIGFIKEPARLSKSGGAIQKWTFNMTPAEMLQLAKVIPGIQGAPESMAVDNLSQTIRLRCIKSRGVELPKLHGWAVADTAWIPYAYFTLNGISLHLRKKIHNGKDLPVDLTGLVREGENVLEIAIVALSNDTSYLNYVIAVELLGVHSHESITKVCLEQNRMPTDRVIEGIKNKLGGITGDDDEIAIVESNLTINLFDPFSASSMCDIPVRSQACLHNDCFDLETFLRTRRRKGSSAVPDQWRCPICNADARPHCLFVDGFLEDVRKALDQQGLSQTRAIIVQQDGSWKPKPEVRDPNGVSDRGATDEPLTPTVARAVPATVEIIDLSD